MADLPDFAKNRLAQLEPQGVEIKENEKLKVYDIPVELLVPTESNPNAMTDETFNVLAEEIDETVEGSPGFIDPIDVVPLDDGRYQIVGGEHRWKAGRAIGMKTVPCILHTDEKWKSEEFREFMLVRLNVIKGSLSPEKFLVMYERYVEKYGRDKLQRLFAITDDDYWSSLVGGTRSGLKDMGASSEMLSDFDERTKEIKSVDELAAILNGLFSKYGNDLKYSFMVFTFGGKEHLYVKMNKEMARQMDAVKEWCRENRADINLVMAPVVGRFGEMVKDPRLAATLIDSQPEVEPEKAAPKKRR